MIDPTQLEIYKREQERKRKAAAAAARDRALGPGDQYHPDRTYGYRLPAQSADDLNRRLTREQFDYFKENFAPREIEFVGSVLSGDYFRGAAEESGTHARGSFDRAQEISDRSVERYGAQVTPQQRQLIQSLRSHSRSLAGSQAENMTRDTTDAIRSDVLTQLTNIGRGVRSGAFEGAGHAARLQAQREATNRQLSAAAAGRRYAGAATGAIVGFGLGGPIGAGIGAVGGFLLG